AARAQAGRERDAIHTRERAARKAAARRVVGRAHAPGHDVALIRGEPARAFPLDGDPHAVGLFGGDLVVERERQAERVEPRPQVGGAGRNADVHLPATAGTAASAAHREPTNPPTPYT